MAALELHAPDAADSVLVLPEVNKCKCKHPTGLEASWLPASFRPIREWRKIRL
ncbi:hypothetical protein ABU162_19690 [Paenibacillus thiaminolyticus]|uniref:hypothetical protein n=1 Tax=Paenibacillus thiaminolyticus TaxID=49283 RepID=UPI0035A6FC4A